MDCLIFIYLLCFISGVFSGGILNISMNSSTAVKPTNKTTTVHSESGGKPRVSVYFCD